MKTSPEGIDLIKRFEGCALKAYWDYKGYSVGYGHLGVPKETTITREEAERLLQEDLIKFEQKVMIYDLVYHWTQNEFDALVSYAYNIGSIKGLVADGTRTHTEIAEEWTRHDMAGGKHLSALRKRREAELHLFMEEKEKQVEVKEKDITICGHGSGRPSLKNMEAYLSYRYGQLATNGKHKGLVKAMRLRTMDDAGRQRFQAAYKRILGRNIYSQPLRAYVYDRYKDGKYYSDCSSSGMAAMQQAGYPISLLNTAGIYRSSFFEEVPIQINAGHILNPEALQVGDALLFVGSDPSRPLQIGHVEYIYEILVSGKKYTPGWNHDEHGWWYVDTEQSYLKSCWKIINHHWYYFGADGYILTGMQQIGGQRYYLTEAGQLTGALCRTDESGALIPWEV